jgi:hypothetical protein
MARPSDYTPELADNICSEIADGQSLRRLCEAEGMPNRSTVLRWLNEHEDFAARYARAREAQGDVMDELILTVADSCTPENAAAARVKIDAYKWRASKLAPKRYGDRTIHAGDEDAPIKASLEVRFV